MNTLYRDQNSRNKMTKTTFGLNWMNPLLRRNVDGDQNIITIPTEVDVLT